MTGLEATRDLADALVARQYAGLAPVPYLLGIECSRAASVPTLGAITRELIKRRKDPRLEDAAELDERLLGDLINQVLKGLSTADRDLVLARATANLPVPQVYQDLGALLAGGYGRDVLTTSYDALLERGLRGAGMRTDRDFRVLAGRHPEPEEDFDGVSIVKLHRALVDDEPTLEPPCPELIVVGYVPGLRFIDEWLATGRERLWWVTAGERPALDDPAVAERVFWIDAEPDDFVGNLLVLLLDLPAADILATSYEALSTRVESASSLEAVTLWQAPAADAAPVEDELPERLLRARVRRCEQTLRRLEEAIAGGDTSSKRQRQVDYQRGELARLEARLLAMTVTKDRLLSLLGEVRAELVKTDPAIAGSVESLVEQAAGQLKAPKPNEMLLASTLSAVAGLAGGLGLDPAIVRELGAFSPHARPT